MKIPARISLFAFALVFLVPLFLPLFPLSPLSLLSSPSPSFPLPSLSPLISFIFPSPAFAASPGEVVINEIMWMGSSASLYDEWLELRNTTDQKVDIGGWQLTRYSSVGGTYQENLMLEIPPEATVSAKGYFLISNNDKDHIFTKGESVLNVVPDLVDSAVSLANTKLQIKLYDGFWDSGGTLIDTVDDGVGKLAAGDNTNKSSMARKNEPGDGTASDSWYTSTASEGFDDGTTERGTPGSENTDAPDEGSPKEETAYSDKIFLNEIMPNPEGSDTEKEYLELYNAGDEEADLSDWVIKDLTGDKIIGSEITPSSTLVPAKGFLVIYKKDGSVSLNNGGDTITLLNPNNEIVDEITYLKVDEDWVYQRYPDGDSTWSESNEPTVGAANKPSSNSSISSTSSNPEVTFSVEDTDLKVNKSFDVKVTIKNAKGLHDYYVKIRLGLLESKLTKGRTHNSSHGTWLADNASWTKFPVVYTDGNGSESLTFPAKVALGNPADTYYIGIRIRDKETEKNYDSETQTLDFGEEEVSNGEDNDDRAGAVLGAATELPATGGGLTSLLVIAWLPVLGWMILIFLGSGTTGASVSENRTIDFIAHKIVHLFEYSVLFILVRRAIKRSFSFIHHSLFTILSFVLTISYAVTDELHQSLVPGRDARLTDILIDAVAAFLGWLFVKRFGRWSKRTTIVDKIRHFFVLVFLLFLASTPAFSASHLSFAVPDGYELKEGEIDHLGGTIEIFDTRAAAISFKPNFNFDLTGFATFVYSYEKYYDELDPSVFTLSIYEKAMEHVNLDDCRVCKARPSEAIVVEGSAGEAPTYQLFFSFEPIAIKSGQDYTAILTTTETEIGRYRFWIRSDYYDGFFLTFNPSTQEFSNPSSGHLGAPFGLFVQEGWQGTPPRFHPVVLIHGIGGRPSDWQNPQQDYVGLIREMYASDEDFEYPSSWIHIYHYGNVGWEYNYQGDIREIALGLEDVVADLAARYAESFGETLESLEERDEDRVVDIVGYSMGGLVARQYLIKHKDNHHVRKLLTVATPHEGIYWLARKEGVGTLPRVGPKLEEAISDIWDVYIAIADKSGQPISLESEAALQMVPESGFLDYLNMVEWTPLDVQYCTIYGDIDIVLKEKIFFFTMEKKVALGDVFIFSESAVGIPAVEPQAFGYNEEWTFPVGMAISPDGVSARFYIEGLDLRKFRFWHLNILYQPEIKDKTLEILAD